MEGEFHPSYYFLGHSHPYISVHYQAMSTNRKLILESASLFARSDRKWLISPFLKFILLSVFCIIFFISCEEYLDPLPIAVVATPKSIDFGQLGLGSCKDTTVDFTNLTNSTDTLRAELSGTAFSFTDTSRLDNPLKAGYAVSIGLRFCPTVAGSLRDTLNIFILGSSHPLASVPLVGIGVQ